MPSLGAAHTRWPVVAWIRLKLPPRPPPMTLMGPPAPLDPPLDILQRNPVATDPRRQVYAFEEDRGDWVLRLVWDMEDPDVLEAEYRSPMWGGRLPKERVPEFWQAVKARVKELGPLPVEAADPRP